MWFSKDFQPIPLLPKQTSSLYDRHSRHYYLTLQMRKQKERDLTKLQIIVGIARIWPCLITLNNNSKIIVIVKVTAIVIVIAIAVSVAKVTEMKTSQLLAICFSSVGRWFSSAPGQRTCQLAAPSPGDFGKPEPVPCLLPFWQLVPHHCPRPSQLTRWNREASIWIN